MTALQALLGFTAWTLLLVVIVVLYRTARFLGGTPVNHWPRGERQTDDAPIMGRVADAHSNCLENLPLFAVIVLAAASLGRLEAIAGLASWVLYARLAQTVAHLTGTGQPHVLVRATFWTAQVVLFIWMLVVVAG